VIVTEANRAGFPSKLTGAGGGGCALILSPVPYNYNDTNDHADCANVGDSGSDDSDDREKRLQLQALIDRIK
jgi:mevalonate kinase